MEKDLENVLKVEQDMVLTLRRFFGRECEEHRLCHLGHEALDFISKNIEDSGVFYGVSFIATQETFPTCYITSACYSDNAGQFEKKIDFRDYIKYGKPEKLHWKISESLTVVEKLQ